jgi:hypothetical protein
MNSSSSKRPNTKLLVSLFTLFIVNAASSIAEGAGRASVSISAQSISPKKIELTFTTQPTTGLVINHDGPWKLEIKDAGGIKPEKLELKRTEWKEDIGGFIVPANPQGKKNTDIKFKLVAFVCTKDKSQCFREVIESTSKVSW